MWNFRGKIPISLKQIIFSKFFICVCLFFVFNKWCNHPCYLYCQCKFLMGDRWKLIGFFSQNIWDSILDNILVFEFFFFLFHRNICFHQAVSPILIFFKVSFYTEWFHVNLLPFLLKIGDNFLLHNDLPILILYNKSLYWQLVQILALQNEWYF